MFFIYCLFLSSINTILEKREFRANLVKFNVQHAVHAIDNDQEFQTFVLNEVETHGLDNPIVDSQCQTKYGWNCTQSGKLVRWASFASPRLSRYVLVHNYPDNTLVLSTISNEWWHDLVSFVLGSIVYLCLFILFLGVTPCGYVMLVGWIMVKHG